VEIAVAIVAGEDSAGIPFGIQKGAVTAGVTIGGSKSSSSNEMELRLLLDMERPPDPVPLKPVPKIPREIARTSAYFEKRGEDKLPTSSLHRLDDWAEKIGKIEELHEVIEYGWLDIHLEGNTSKSGAKDFNAKLATQRIESVERALNKHFGSKVLYKRKPKDQSKYEEKNDYRVDVFFKKEDAEKAILRMNSWRKSVAEKNRR
jgi:hypothetical protein